MIGMNKQTGRRISDIDHIRQSVADILMTPIGTRVMRRDYGSLLSELIDHPGNDANNLRMMAASVMALSKWETRISIGRVGISLAAVGEWLIDLDCSVVAYEGRTSFALLNVSLGGLR